MLPQSAANHGNYAFRDVARFVCSLLQKMKKNSLLVLVEQREEYRTPNQSEFFAIDEEWFIFGKPFLVALEEASSYYLKSEL